MSPHDSANARMLGTATNFFLSGPLYSLGRDALEKRFGFRDKNSLPEPNKLMIERGYGFVCSLGEIDIKI